jgi:glutathione S-transferase
MATRSSEDNEAGDVSILGYWNTRALAEPIRLLLHFVGEKFIDKRYQVGPPPNYDKSEWMNVKHSLDLDFPNLPYFIDPVANVRLTQTHAIIIYLGMKHSLHGRNILDQARAIMIAEALRDWINAFFDVTYCNAPWIADAEPSVHKEGQSQCSIESPRLKAASEKYLATTLPEQLAQYSNLITKHTATPASPASTMPGIGAQGAQAGDQGAQYGAQGPLEGAQSAREGAQSAQVAQDRAQGARENAVGAQDAQESADDAREGAQVMQGPWLLGSYLTFVDFILAEYLMQHLLFEPSCLESFPALQDYLARFQSLPSVSAYLSVALVEPIHNRYSHFHCGWK